MLLFSGIGRVKYVCFFLLPYYFLFLWILAVMTGMSSCFFQLPLHCLFLWILTVMTGMSSCFFLLRLHCLFLWILTVMTGMSSCSSYFMVCAGFRWFVCSRGGVENYWAGNSQVLCKQMEPLWLRDCHCQYCQHHSGTAKRQGNSLLEGFQTCKHLFSSSLSCSFRSMKSITLYDTDTVKLQQKHFP